MQDWTSQMLFLFPIIGRLDIKYPWRGACRILLSYDCGGTVDLGVCESCRSTAKLTHGAHCVKHHVWWRVVPIKCGASMRHIRTNMCQEKSCHIWRGWGGVILAVHINFLRHFPTPFITYIQLYIIHIYILAQKKLHSGANAVTWCFLGLEMGQLRSYGPVVLTQISKYAACPAQSGRYKN